MTTAQQGELKDKLAKTNGSTPAKQPTVLDLIERMKPQIARALPKHMDPERLTRIVLTTLRTTPKLLECTPQSLLAAVMLSAQLGLEPGPLGHCYFVPFRNKRTGNTDVQFIVGYKGYIDLARRSGTIVDIAAREVCEHDHFEFEYGLEERLIHRPALTGRGAPIAYYGVAHFRDGGHMILVMSREDIEAYRRRSRASDDGPWVSDYDAMAKKTVIRRMASFMPLSVEVARAVAQDEAVKTEIADDMADVIDITPEAETAAATE